MNEVKISKLKQALFMAGTDAIDDFTGVDGTTAAMDKDAIENLMDEVIDQMPEEEFDKFYDKYVGKEEDPEDDISIYSLNDLIAAYQSLDASSQSRCRGDAVLNYMSELTGKSVDYLYEKISQKA